MNRIPFPAVFIGVAGLLPFVYGAALILAPEGRLPGFGLVEASGDGGLHMLETFGAVILGFMGGCLWGFASPPGRSPTLGLLAAASAPAFIAFVALGPDPAISCVWLAFGFAALQGIDVIFHRARLAPDYWLHLRLPLTGIVIACLLIGALYG
jgi:hypothetical protein